MRYWLMKTEPDTFSFDDLVSAPQSTECWDGVRNYQARNMMRDDFKKGDQVFIYHSRTASPSIVGIAQVVREGYPDDTALDPKSKYFDEKSAAQDSSRWVMVDVQATQRFKVPVSLQQVKQTPGLEAMPLVQRGQRLSIQPVEASQWQIICQLGQPEDVG